MNTNKQPSKCSKSVKSIQRLDENYMLSLSLAEKKYWQLRAKQAIEENRAGRTMTWEEFKKAVNW